MATIQNAGSATWLLQMEALFKACADQTRLRILNMLACAGEICVCHLVEVLKTNQPKVSRHLAYLKRAGLVIDRKDGLRVYYRIVSPLPAYAEKMFDCLNSCCEEVPEMRQDVMSLETVVRRASFANLPRQAKATSTATVVVEETKEWSDIRVELL